MKLRTPYFLERWRRSSTDRIGLDFLLGQSPAPDVPLRDRLNWLSRLLNWARSARSIEKGKLPIVRLKYILQILDHNPQLKIKIAETLRSIIHDTSALELFMNIGIPNQEGFLGELVERFQLRILPQAPPR